MVSDIVEFLRARLDEDEAAAQASRSILLIIHTDRCAVPGSDEEATYQHFDRHSPSRVLAEVAAKRVVVDDVESMLEQINSEWGTRPLDESDWAAEPALQAMASVYSDHKDYRQEWKP